MKLIFPDYALACLETIENNGFEAWFVGGAVRDVLLNRELCDVDITTNALPTDIMRIFQKTIPTGLRHGTVTVLIDGNPIEVTTYRSDIDYKDNRHPESVKFEKNIEFDLSRRDFTINALAYHPTRGLLDLFCGLADIERKRIVAVGCPEKRFLEDALRILRAFRFSSVLGFEIADETLDAAYNCAHRIKSLSGERILAELKKLSQGENPAVITQLINMGALSSFGILSARDNLNSILKVNSKYRTAMFLSLFELNYSDIKDNLKPDNVLFGNIILLKHIYDKEIPGNKTELKLILSDIGKENADLYFESIKTNYSDYIVSTVLGFMNEIHENHEPYTIKALDINGKDLMRLGISGEEVGKTLEKIKLAVISDPSLNEKEKLIQLANKIM